MSDGDGDYTVLSDFTSGDGKSHREFAEHILPQLAVEMSDEEWDEFTISLRKVVLEQILFDLQSNLQYEDWYGAGFESPEDFLDAKKVSQMVGQTAEHYFKEDQIGKSWEVFQIIVEHGKRHGLVEMQEDGDQT